MKFSIITPTIQRDSLLACCASINSQTHTDWQHIVVIDGGPSRHDLLDLVADSHPGHTNRTLVHLGGRCNNFGNTPRFIGWKLAHGDYVIYLDDDNYFARNDALADIASRLESSPDWAVFPILRFGQRFFSADPGCCHVDTANMVIRREIAQWPNREEYTLDGIFCEQLKAQHPYIAFPEVDPIIVVPVQGKGE